MQFTNIFGFLLFQGNDSEGNGPVGLARDLCKFNECQNLSCWPDQTSGFTIVQTLKE